MSNNKFLKYASYLVVLVVGILIGFSAGRDYQNPIIFQERQQNNQVGTVGLMVDYGNGKVETFQGTSISGPTKVFDVLKSTADKNKIILGYKDYGGDMGIFIESIGGIGKDPTSQKWWQFWVNNQYSQVGVSSYLVQPGDNIEFKFVPGQI